MGRILAISGLLIFVALPFLGRYQLSESELRNVVSNDQHFHALVGSFKSGVIGSSYNLFEFTSVVRNVQEDVNNAFRQEQAWDKVIYEDYAFGLTKVSSKGIVAENPWLFFCLVFFSAIAGGLLMIWADYREERLSINYQQTRCMTSRGVLAAITGGLLIGFYIFLYWFPEYVVNWVVIVDPLSQIISGARASQWFLYGLLYTLVILVMGVRMLLKHRGKPYHLIRTASLMFFQLSFAFVIPEVMKALNLPSQDFKNIWPLDYSFFFDYRLDAMVQAGTIGYFMLFWGIGLFVIGVPVLTYFYGKRWYCSWVCGCGGLAETMGDPFRHLSSKKLSAWQFERYSVHGVLVFAVVMTVAVLYTYFSGSAELVNLSGISVSSYDVREWYGFAIGAAFAGVVGTGFYPFMGNRVWCRFGCPLAAYLGLVQRFKSRFRITTNGGQCISCGNCSTNCEMGIDVRWYAQRGQNIVRSSCVGCGICATVCPRGVLKLENGKDDGQSRTEAPAILIGNDSIRLNV